MAARNSFERAVELSERKIFYTLRLSRRARRMRLTIYPDSKLVLTMPHFVNVRGAEEFIARKSDWILEKLDYLKHVQGTTPFLDRRERFLDHKEQARILVENKIRYFNQIYQFPFRRVFIRDQRTLWGSCSQKGNLNFNYKIVFLPESVQDYLIVHELCHLQELNHSDSFWNLVAKAVPNYRELRRELKRNVVFRA